VRLDGDRIVDIGKHLDDFEAYDTGAFLCSPEFLERMAAACEAGETALSDGVRRSALAGLAGARVVSPGSWIDVDDGAQLTKAHAFLLASLGKPTDGPVSRHLNRPLSRRLSAVLAKRGVSPNAISLAAFSLALAGAGLFLVPGYWPLVLGGLLIQTASVVDGSDGEVARLLFRSSEFGFRLDQVLDRYADAFIIAALTYRVAGPGDSWLPLLLGLLALVGSFVSSYTAPWFDQLNAGRSGGLLPRLPRLGRDVRLLLVALAAVAYLPLLALGTLAVLMNLDVVRRLLTLRRSGAA
jgi:1L-myo-inositol 1-phosphate cytidylyltransferase / CDP-L-myo-inositol myo-inositolphosphotransferase